MRRLFLPALVAALAIGATSCGDSGPSSPDFRPAEEASERRQAPKPESEPPKESVSGGFTGVDASNYEAAKEICSAFPKEQIAQELDLPASADEFDIAEAYADDGYTDRFRQAGFEGCLDGLLE
jgi:hypothetical protein